MADTRVDELRRRLEKDPGSRLFAQLAEELRKDGELVEAIRIAREGLAVHASYPSARLTLGRALLDSGDAVAARVELESALRDAPDNILASRYLAQARESLGDLAGAAEQYRKTLLMAPGDRQLEAALAAVQARLSAPSPGATLPGYASTAEARAEAPLASTVRIQASETVVPTAPEIEEGEAPATTSSITLPAGKVSAMPEPAAEAAPPFSSPTLAELYYQQGLVDRAVDVYRQVVQHEPGNDKARSRLSELEAASAVPQEPAARRLALERTIARLETLLVAVRRR